MSAPPMGVLQRALSRRDTGIKIEQPEAFDQKKILEHITEDEENGEIVVASSPGALSSAIEKSKVRDGMGRVVYTAGAKRRWSALQTGR